MNAPADEPPYPDIREMLFAGEVIPFLGAGASMGERQEGVEPKFPSQTQMPLAGELAALLAERMELGKEVSRDLGPIAQLYASKLGWKKLRLRLSEVFVGDQPLRTVHRLLGRVPAPLLIVTTNYDDLIERALAEREGARFDVVVQTIGIDRCDVLHRPHGGSFQRVEDPDLLDLDIGGRTVVYKIHGTVVRGDAGSGEYIITEDDYLEFLSQMTRNRVVPAPIATLFGQRPFLFLGYGLRDWNVRLLLHELRPFLRHQNVPDQTSWAIDERPSVTDMRFWRARGVDIYPMSLDVFAERILGAADEPAA